MPQQEAPIRLQEYGVGIFQMALTKSAFKKVLKKKYVTVNDARGTTATFIYGGEQIILSIPKEKESDKRLIFPLKVLFEDDHLAVIHKPAGILVSGNSFKTIANALDQNLVPSQLFDATKPQPVHRLDYATTGILLVGKTKSSIRSLCQLFEDRAIQKSYFAVSIGEMPSEGEMNTEVDDKTARSTYIVKDSVPSERFGTLNLVQLTPYTGRRHQLRQHLAHRGNPILGDQQYGEEPLILNGKGLYLHAHSLAFVHPFTQEKLYVIDKLPERFTKIFPSKSEQK